jgi:hypothetical protein
MEADLGDESALRSSRSVAIACRVGYTLAFADSGCRRRIRPGDRRSRRKLPESARKWRNW